VCAAADAVVAAYNDWYHLGSPTSEEAREWQEYWGTVIMSLVSASTSTALVWFFTRKPKADLSVPPYDAEKNALDPSPRVDDHQAAQDS
jgi:hypothetical protein